MQDLYKEYGIYYDSYEEFRKAMYKSINNYTPVICEAEPPETYSDIIKLMVDNVEYIYNHYSGDLLKSKIQECFDKRLTDELNITLTNRILQDFMTGEDSFEKMIEILKK